VGLELQEFFYRLDIFHFCVWAEGQNQPGTFGGARTGRRGGQKSGRKGGSMRGRMRGSDGGRLARMTCSGGLVALKLV